MKLHQRLSHYDRLQATAWVLTSLAPDESGNSSSRTFELHRGYPNGTKNPRSYFETICATRYNCDFYGDTTHYEHRKISGHLDKCVDVTPCEFELGFVCFFRLQKILLTANSRDTSQSCSVPSGEASVPNNTASSPHQRTRRCSSLLAIARYLDNVLKSDICNFHARSAGDIFGTKTLQHLRCRICQRGGVVRRHVVGRDAAQDAAWGLEAPPEPGTEQGASPPNSGTCGDE